MAKTKAQMVTLTLRYLGVLEAQETASAEDENDVGELFDIVYAELEEEGIAYWASTATPDYLAQHVARLIAAYAAPQFSGAFQEAIAYVGAAEPAMRKIRALTAKPDTGEATSQDYF